MTPKLRTQILRHVEGGEDITDDECWPWQGAMSGGGVPTLKCEGKVVNVRRLVLTDRGTPPGRGVASTRCLTPKCVSPGCTIATTRKVVRKRCLAALGPQSTLGARHKVAQARRAAEGKFTPELVQRIRTDGRTLAAWAEELGVSEAAVSAVRRGVTWKDYHAGPFAGLGAP